MIVKLLTGHHLEFLSLTGDCPGSSESTLVKMANCWKSHDTAHMSSASYIFIQTNFIMEANIMNPDKGAV